MTDELTSAEMRAADARQKMDSIMALINVHALLLLALNLCLFLNMLASDLIALDMWAANAKLERETIIKALILVPLIVTVFVALVLVLSVFVILVLGLGFLLGLDFLVRVDMLDAAQLLSCPTSLKSASISLFS